MAEACKPSPLLVDFHDAASENGDLRSSSSVTKYRSSAELLADASLALSREIASAVSLLPSLCRCHGDVESALMLIEKVESYSHVGMQSARDVVRVATRIFDAATAEASAAQFVAMLPELSVGLLPHHSSLLASCSEHHRRLKAAGVHLHQAAPALFHTRRSAHTAADLALCIQAVAGTGEQLVEGFFSLCNELSHAAWLPPPEAAAAVAACPPPPCCHPKRLSSEDGHDVAPACAATCTTASAHARVFACAWHDSNCECSPQADASESAAVGWAEGDACQSMSCDGASPRTRRDSSSISSSINSREMNSDRERKWRWERGCAGDVTVDAVLTSNRGVQETALAAATSAACCPPVALQQLHASLCAVSERMARASQQLSSLQLEVQQHLAVVRGRLQAVKEHGAGEPLWTDEDEEGVVQRGTRGRPTAGWLKHWHGLWLGFWMRGWRQGGGRSSEAHGSGRVRGLALTLTAGGAVVVLTALALAIVTGKTGDKSGRDDGWPAFIFAAARQKQGMKSDITLGRN